MKFMLKAGLIEAVQYRREENINEVQYFFEITKENGRKLKYLEGPNEYGVVLKTKDNLTKVHILEKGEYILRHIDGKYEVLPEERFKKLYGRVTS